MEQVTEIITSSLSVNVESEVCALCNKSVKPCGGICDYTNTGWQTWHYACYEEHRKLLGMERRFIENPKFPLRSTFEPQAEVWITGPYPGETESEFLGDVGDKC